MKTVLLFLVFSLTATAGFAHEYFFAFAEMDYNASEKRFEVTVEASAHDVEDALNAWGTPVKELEDHYADPDMLEEIQVFINNGLSVSSRGIATAFTLKGFEVRTNGLVYFYLQSEVIEPKESINITFNWLMDVFPEQQNKITLRYNDQKYTDVFLPGKLSAIIEL